MKRARAGVPGWSFQGSAFSKTELLAQRDRMIADHPRTRFICAHVANFPEDLAYVASFLDSHANAAVDLSARIYGLGLPAEALRKIYSENALRIIPGLKL